MKDLILPESREERKEAYERLIAQLMTRVSLTFPEEEIDKEEFLSEVIVPYEEDKSLSRNFSCKWGTIDEPVVLPESLKDEIWDFDGVKKFFDFYTWRREIIRKEKEEIRKQKEIYKKEMEERRITRKQRRKENKEKYRSYDEPLCKQLEQELNNYGRKFGVRSDLEYLKNWKGEWFEIKAYIGVFHEYAVYTCSYEEMKRELKTLVRESLKHPELLKEINEEWDYFLA